MNTTRYLVTFLALALPAGSALAAIRVVCTNADIYAIAREIATSDFEISLLVPPDLNPHAVPMRPSMIQKIRQAEVLMTIGLDHEPWLMDALTSSGNSAVMPSNSGSGYVDCSRGIELLQVPTSGSISRAGGDIHVFGNTHYWLDPKNGRIMAFHIQKALAARFPEKESEIKDKARAFLKDLDARTARWKQQMAPYRGTKVASYHLTWAYLENFLGLQLIGTVEPKPGIPPTPAHVAGLKETMKRDKVKVLMVETYYNMDTANSVASEAGGQAVVLSPSTREGEKYADHIERLISQLEAAFKK